MTISLHCQSCKKKIKAPDNAGGKWGKCPFCKHKCYVPLPPAPEEEQIKLAPIDESSETHYGDLMKETHELTKNILHETAMPDDDDTNKGPISEKELLRAIIFYLRNVAQGNLEKAEQYASILQSHKEHTQDLLDRLMRTSVSEPELADIPPKLLAGLMKNLKNQLNQ